MSRQDSDETVKRLKDMVEMHHLCYEIWPELLIVKSQQVKVGFNLELAGTHEHGTSTLSPGCPRCIRTFDDLREIAEWTMPKEEQPSRYEIEPFDRALHESAQRNFQPEVVLSMKILHRHGFDQPVDAYEERCLKEMRGKLAELGRAGRRMASDKESGSAEY